MKVWLYYRLSRDEDDELNSLTNQRKIIYEYAVTNGHEVVGESFDDNVSGMHFNREGIDKIYEVVEAGKIEAIIVKDLSRLGRHRTQTALFIDYLREHDVRVLSATENIDTFNENDDLIIGFKGLVNDFYARDGSRRVRTGYRQKQKEGLVTIPPFGYFKDKNTKKVVIVEEAAETVRLIFTAYVGGSGMKTIARTLNEQKRKTPALMQLELLNKSLPNTQDVILKKYLWDATMIARILRDESYVGTLICHKSERNKINKTFRFTEPEEQFRHENYLPPIITPELWEQTQMMLAERKRLNVRAAPSQEILRYSGLLRCADCGRVMFGRRIHLKSGERVTYVCSTYNRFGKEHCSQHQIDESVLDRLIIDELRNTKALYQQNWDALEQLIAQWTPKAELTGAQIVKLEKRIRCLEDETEAILMERIRDRANAERYDRMIQKREEEIAAAKKQIEELQNISAVLRNRQTKLKRDISMIDDILSEGVMTEAHLRMLVEKIYVQETDGKLSLDIQIKAPFRTHLDVYMIGVRGLMNDYYAKDIGKKIRAGYRQKQKEGLVITPPFGYWKDKNTGQIRVDTEAAVTVRHIYSLYLHGCGQKEIARRLNSFGRKTPAQIRAERLGYDSQKSHKTRDGQFLWTYASVKNILMEEAYTGVLNNHRREYNNGKVKRIDETDWYRHEGFFPVIIGKQEWEQVQRLLKQQGPPRKRQSGQAPLCGTADLPGMWEYVHSYDSLLERQESCGICVPWIPPEWKNLLCFPPYP